MHVEIIRFRTLELLIVWTTQSCARNLCSDVTCPCGGLGGRWSLVSITALSLLLSIRVGYQRCLVHMNGRRCLVHIKQGYILIISNSESEWWDVKVLTLDAGVMQLYEHLSVFFSPLPRCREYQGNSRFYYLIWVNKYSEGSTITGLQCPISYNWASVSYKL